MTPTKKKINAELKQLYQHLHEVAVMTGDAIGKTTVNREKTEYETAGYFVQLMEQNVHFMARVLDLGDPSKPDYRDPHL